jgi:hypothetical protein
MLKSKLLWAFVLGGVTSVFLTEAKINLGYGPVWTRVLDVLTAPGTRFAATLNAPGVLMQGWTRFWAAAAFVCNLLVYFVFWYAFIAITSYLRSRRNPYDRQNTLVPPVPGKSASDSSLGASE